jgi:hypothetical protein
MNIVKWIFAVIATGLVLITISTSDLFAKDEWVAKPVICNESHQDILEKFYYEENLHPLLGGTTRIRMGKDPDELVDGVVYVMYDAENNSIAIMEYTSDQVCALGFIHDVEFDVDTLKGYMGYER